MGIALIVYGVIILGGGIAGFRSAGSRASLMMGAVSGLMLAISGAMVISGNRIGGYFGVGVTAALILVFAMRYAKTKKMKPAGLLLAISVIMAAILYTELGG
ncbi:MAG TPA: TMEM14 family protein [Terriglobia bacterium]|nr:TMEM14 family protein [Terriglobia bacterium]